MGAEVREITRLCPCVEDQYPRMNLLRANALTSRQSTTYFGECSNRIAFSDLGRRAALGMIWGPYAGQEACKSMDSSAWFFLCLDQSIILQRLLTMRSHEERRSASIWDA